MREDEEHETWARLFDKGFQGIQKSYDSNLPVKKPLNPPLSPEEVKFNGDIAKERERESDSGEFLFEIKK